MKKTRLSVEHYRQGSNQAEVGVPVVAFIWKVGISE
jgi:hypothetical protein